MVLHLDRGDRVDQRYVITAVSPSLQYTRNDMAFQRGTYRVRGDVIDVFPAESEKRSQCASNCSTTRSTTSPPSIR